MGLIPHLSEMMWSCICLEIGRQRTDL